MNRAGLVKRKLGFFIIIAITGIPLILCPLIPTLYRQLDKGPLPENGVLDLEGYDFRNSPPLFLDGQWEFFWNRWIVSDPLPGDEPGTQVSVPSPWNRYATGEDRLPNAGYASYRLLLKNCPTDVPLVAFIPNLGAAYRIFLDGKLLATSGTPHKNPTGGDVTLSLVCERPPPTPQPESVLVIEMSASMTGGLYLTPILTDNASNFHLFGFRYILAAMMIGILLVTTGFYTYIQFIGDRTIRCTALLVLDVLVFVRILFKDEFFSVLKSFMPTITFYSANALLQLLALFCPMLFALCARDLLGLPLKPRFLRHVMLFECLVLPPMLYGILEGRMLLQYGLTLVSYAPFLLVLRQLYRAVKGHVPYATTVSMGMALTVSSLIASSQYALGVVSINLSLYPPFCFILASFLEDYMYVRRNSEMRQEALENAKLRLRLREAETSLMLSQIKPHFLYNALIAIQVLCAREPETAQEAIIQFAKYLRANMQSINSRAPIPFIQELEHIQNYVAIEKLRFKNRLQMVYDIGVTGFSVPPLTLQPLIENAIKHGACKKVLGGTVTLRTWAEKDVFCVAVSDDGPGFDTSILDSHTGETADSYGLQNISCRLREWVHADIAIQSTPESGTTVTVRIPASQTVEER